MNTPEITGFVVKKIYFCGWENKKELFDIQFEYFRLIMIPEPSLGKIVFYEYIQFRNAFQFYRASPLS